jgi:hypothetical protein
MLALDLDTPQPRVRGLKVVVLWSDPTSVELRDVADGEDEA